MTARPAAENPRDLACMTAFPCFWGRRRGAVVTTANTRKFISQM
jgi:hypothetical protein